MIETKLPPNPSTDLPALLDGFRSSQYLRVVEKYLCACWTVSLARIMSAVLLLAWEMNVYRVPGCSKVRLWLTAMKADSAAVASSTTVPISGAKLSNWIIKLTVTGTIDLNYLVTHELPRGFRLVYATSHHWFPQRFSRYPSVIEGRNSTILLSYHTRSGGTHCFFYLLKLLLQPLYQDGLLSFLRVCSFEAS